MSRPVPCACPPSGAPRRGRCPDCIRVEARRRKRAQRGFPADGIPLRRCAYCGDMFQPRQRNQKYDTRICFDRDRRAA